MSQTAIQEEEQKYSVVRHSALYSVLEKFRSSAKTEREKGTYFEELIQSYLESFFFAVIIRKKEMVGFLKMKGMR